MAGQRSRICVAIDDANLRRRVHRALGGIAHEMVDIDNISEPGTVRRVGDERLLTVVGSRVGGADLTPAALARLRVARPLVRIIVWLPPRHQLLRRLGDLAIAGADRVVVLDAPDEDADLRRDVREAIKHVLPVEVDLGVNASVPSRGVATELWCARNGYLHLNEKMIADVFDVDRGTILKAVKREGWQDVEGLVTVSRVLHIAAEFGQSSMKVPAIARSLHFESPSALHHFVKRATQKSSRQLRFEGAPQMAVALWWVRGATPTQELTQRSLARARWAASAAPSHSYRVTSLLDADRDHKMWKHYFFGHFKRLCFFWRQ